MASKTERRTERHADIAFHADVGRIVEIELGIGIFVIDGRRHETFLDRKRGDRGFNGPGRAEQVGVHRFRRRDIDRLGALFAENALERLENARRVAKNANMDRSMLVFLGGQSYVLFPWLGTRAFRTLKRVLKKNADELGVFDIQSELCYYITFKAKNDAASNLLFGLRAIIERGLVAEELVFDGECPVFDKFDDFIPPSLLRAAYAKDRLCTSEVEERFG